MSKPIYITHYALPGYLLWLQTHKDIANAADITPVQHNDYLRQYYRHLDDIEIDKDSNEYREKFNRG